MIGVSELKVMTANKGQALPSAKPNGSSCKSVFSLLSRFRF
jgi:hypothetical protein